MSDNPLYGTPDSDLLQIGDGSGADTIYGDEGNDTIFGHDGDDWVSGDFGNDRVWGGDGNDRVDGLDGDDRLFGGRGNDFFDAGWGDDTVYGGAGNDGISAGYGSDLIYGGDGDDGISSGGLISFGFDTIYGGAGNDNAAFMGWGTGHFDGGEGQDTIAFHWLAPGGDFWADVHVDMTAASPVARSFSTKANADQEITFENVEALSIQTGFGDDTIIGADGDDAISVAGGSNIVDGGGGDDYIYYHTANANTLEGGTGTDILVVDNPGHLVLDFDASGPTATDGFGSVLTGFERFEVHDGAYADRATLGSGDDAFFGTRGNDTAFGGAGDDRLDGGRDDDDLQGDAGNDRLNGGLGNDTLYGDDGNDRLLGGHDADMLFGGGGRDRLVGSSGADVMWGGAERDTFRFTSPPEAAAPDQIGDFASGEDRLVFEQRLLDGSPGSGRMTDADLSFGAVSGALGQFLYVASGSEGSLYWDADGTGAQAATLLVILTNGATLIGSDIYIL